MGMQSLRFRKGQRDGERDALERKPPAMLMFGMCLLVGAAVVAIMLAAVRLGLVDAIRELLQ